MAKTVCVIGAGISGLSAVKACLEEGLEPTCYESRWDIGGNWNYKKYERNGTARVYESLVTNVSKEASCFSDFPYPKEYSPYFPHAKFLEYLKSYAAHFDLDRHIILNTKVENVVQTYAEDQKKRKWRVTTRNALDNTQKTQEFDSVIVCSGLNSSLKMPKIQGLSDGSFKGRVMHSSEYDSSEEFTGKKVVVIGLGNSGGDLATEISTVADTVYLSSRSGAWIIPRMFKEGLPGDMTAATRLKSFVRAAVPKFLGDWFAAKLINSAINHDTIGVRSKYGPMTPRAQFVVNDDIASRIFSGHVRVVPDVVLLDKTEVTFSDDTKVEADVVICATGYETKFPFIADEILPSFRSELRLYEWMIPFDVPFNPESFAVVGFSPSAGGSTVPIYECQARYVAQVMSGVTKLPSREKMRERFEQVRSGFSGDKDNFRFRAQLGFGYQDGIAKLAGFYPYFWTLFFRDPRLALAVQVGPFVSYHYRLFGRHKWSGARDRILNVIPNTLSGLGTIHEAKP